MKTNFLKVTSWPLFAPILCTLAAANPSLTLAQEAADAAPITVGSIAYSGQLSPAELMTEEYQRITSLDADAEISFNVSVPIVEKGKVLVQNVEGLPLGMDESGSSPSEATISVPFSTAEFQDRHGLDEISFAAAVDDTLKNLREDTETSAAQGKKLKGSTTQSGALNQPNCGGYPLGTVIRVSTQSCLLGSTVNEYTCMTNPNTGQRDWYLTSSQWILPSITNCYPGGN